MKSRNPSLLSNSGPPRRAAALPNRPNCIVSPSGVKYQGSGTACASAVSNNLFGHALLSPPPATASAEGAQLNGRPFPATASAEGAQFNVPPSRWERELKAPSRLVLAGLPLRHVLSGPLPAEPVGDGIPHDQLLVASLEPGQLFREHRHALPVRARHAGDIGAPEAALRAERVKDLPDILVNVAVGIGLARIARRTGELHRDIGVFGQ